jgi:hypothetical protein
MTVLLAGWFSFEAMGATAGDVMARDVALGWIAECGLGCDVATAAPFYGGVDWTRADPSRYSHVVFVCGPFGNGPPLVDFLERFRACPLIGLDLSLLEPLDEWNPFAHVIERDSTRRTHPDLAFLRPQPLPQVVGLCLVHEQDEYRTRGRHAAVNDALQRALARRDVAVLPIDTRLDANAIGLRSAGQVEALVNRTDFVVTTRLHGLVLAIKNGVPALAVDPIVGGAKVAAQARTIGWPALLEVDQLTDANLDAALDYCGTREARRQAARSRRIAVTRLQPARAEFIAALLGGSLP